MDNITRILGEKCNFVAVTKATNFCGMISRHTDAFVSISLGGLKSVT